MSGAIRGGPPHEACMSGVNRGGSLREERG